MSTVTELAERLEGFANQLVGRYGHPVYLVGSALEQGDSARDVDLRVIVPHDEFVGRYGWMRWASSWDAAALRMVSDTGKLAAGAAEHLKLNIDLQVQSNVSVCSQHHGRPRLRIDKTDVPEVEMFKLDGCDCDQCRA